MFDFRRWLEISGDYSAGHEELNPRWSNPGDLYKVNGVELSDDYSDKFSFALIVNDYDNKVWIDLDWYNHYFDANKKDVTLSEKLYPNGFCGNGCEYTGIESVEIAVKEFSEKLNWLNEKDLETVKRTIDEAYSEFVKWFNR